MKAATVGEWAAFAALEPEWWALWARSPCATPFSTPAWLLPWWRAFAPGALSVVTVREEGALVGLAPLYRDGDRLLPIGIALSDYVDVLLDPRHRAAAAAAIVAQVAADPRWRVWELPDLAGWAEAWNLPVPPGTVERADRAATAGAVLALPARLPGHRRGALRNALNRATRQGEVTFALSGEADDLLRLHASRWTSRGKPGGVLADPRVAAFLTEAVPRLDAAGLARLRLLRIGGRVAGAWLSLLHGGRGYAYLSGFDPELAFAGPGTLVLGHLIGETAREGAVELDFLRGAERYKFAWGCSPRFSGRRVFERRGSAQALGDCAQGVVPANVAVVRMIAAGAEPQAIDRAFERLAAARRLWEENRDSWPALRGILDAVADGGGGEAFDRAVAISPEASVALYSLGRADLLERATAEIVGWLASAGLIGAGRIAVEIGCGIGRFMVALAGHGTATLGVDVSAGMLREAARRCRDLAALPVRGGGRDLAFVADASADLVLAIDSFPYLVRCGVAAAHFAEAGRVLKPGGALLVMNWSYRGDHAADADDAARLAAQTGLRPVPGQAPELRWWDGTSWLFEREG